MDSAGGPLVHSPLDDEAVVPPRVPDGVAEGRSESFAANDAAAPGKLAMLFTGQGAQRPGMGSELYLAYPVFADTLDEVIEHLDVQLDKPLRDVMFGAYTADLDGTQYAQCAMFAIEVALARLLESWGVRPDILLGRSIGELSAAHIAGVWTLPDACIVVAARGRLIQALPQGGAMIAIAATEDEIGQLVADQSVSIAAVYGPSSVVISGVERDVLELASVFALQGRQTTRLRVEHAFHSPLVEPILDDYRDILRLVHYANPRIPVVSNVTGRIATADELCSPGYWAWQVRRPVRFADGVTTLIESGVTTSVEVGPQPVLSAISGAVPGAEGMVFAPTMRAGRSEIATVVGALGTLHTRSVPLDWDVVSPALRRKVDPVTVRAASVLTGHRLLDAPLSLRTQPWLADHTVAGTVVVPGSAFVELALYAAERTGAAQVAELTLHAPLVVPETRDLVLAARLGRARAGTRGFEFFARPDRDEDARWTRHASGVLADRSVPPPVPPGEWPPAGAEVVTTADRYRRLAAAGHGYGRLFQGLRTAWRHGTDVYADVVLPDRGARMDGFDIHPALLDAVLQAAEFAPGEFSGTDGPRLPFAMAGIRRYTGAITAAKALLTSPVAGGVGVLVADSTGAPVLSIDSYRSRPVHPDELVAAEHEFWN